MSYVDAIYSREHDKVYVVERINGSREYTEYPASYVFYFEDPHGKYRTMWDRPCSKVSTNSYKIFKKELAAYQNRIIHESDIKPVFRCLAENYTNVPAPTLNVGMFDIETDFDPERGFSDPLDAFNAITAVTLHLSHLNKLITLVLKPNLKPTDALYMTDEAAQEICDQFTDTFLCESEEQLLKSFLDLIDDVDILSGWNSSGFDIPYIYNRIVKILGKEYTKKLCLWNQLPKERKYTKFGREQTTYDLVGRIHVDYLEIYRKYSPGELHSYRLDFVAEIELGENKTPYEGTLDMLYKKDFAKFIEYNRQDTMLLVKIDKKKKFISLLNQLAHTNTVLLPTTMGTVMLVDQAITNEAWARGYQVPDHKNRYEDRFSNNEDEEQDDGPVVGAFVIDPKVGLIEHVGAVDINSLYPSTIRALNMGPETLVGQIRPIATAAMVEEKLKNNVSKHAVWQDLATVLEYESVINKTDDILIVEFEDGSEIETTGAQLYDYIYNPKNNLCLSSNGTIFKTDFNGIIPGLLEKWYAERKTMQKKSKEADAAGDTVQAEYWDIIQFTKKLLLNGLYGALLNEGSRFFDRRLGQSVTMTGRSIVKHMNSKINEIITGKYDMNGEAIIYADTDSSYFSMTCLMKENPELQDIMTDKNSVIDLYDNVADQANASFPEFMTKNFNVSMERGGIIKAGRELVASRGLFITKKRYAVLIYDKEGKRLDVDGSPGKIKAMGLDLKRSDTPKLMQQFLEKVLLEVLQGADPADIVQMIKKFRQDFRNLDGWLKGSPKKVNALSDYFKRLGLDRPVDGSTDILKNLKKAVDKKIMVPGHVQASINWNFLKKLYSDKYSMSIQDGQKIIVCKLKPNPLKMTSIAYPIDEPHIPDWFKSLPFDHETMENTIIDMKIENLLGCLKWDLRDAKEDNAFNDLFEF